METGSWLTLFGLILALSAVGHSIQEEGPNQHQPADSEENLVEKLSGLVSLAYKDLFPLFCKQH